MRRATTAIVLMMICYAANSQKLVLMPQFGVQTFHSNVSSNSPFQGYKAYSSFSPSLGAKLMYFSRSGHGPYLGFHVGDMNVSSYDSFANYTTGIMHYRIEAGYQWLTKPIYFKRIWENNISLEDFHNTPRKGLAVQLMPSLGLVYTRGRPGQNSYSNISATHFENFNRSNFGLQAGLGFNFMNNGRQLFNLSISHTRGFGNLYSSSIYGNNGLSYQSTKGNSWSFTVGIPITILGRSK
jgi:hypothetical protein